MNLVKEIDALRQAVVFGREKATETETSGLPDTRMARYHTLVDKENRKGLTKKEARELADLVAELEREEEPLRQAIEQRAAEEHQRHLEEMGELRALSARLDTLLARLRPEMSVSSLSSPTGDP
jgi:type II secretory pathway component PulK